MATSTPHAAVKEWGADAALENRPGVPMEKEVRVPAQTIERQMPTVPIIHKRVELNRLTPVYGTVQPPKGLSGLIRRAAYGIPDNRMSHWMMLMLGDRIDVIENDLSDLVTRPTLGLFITLGAVVASITYLQRRKQSWF
jgi:hypothetical protein